MNYLGSLIYYHILQSNVAVFDNLEKDYNSWARLHFPMCCSFGIVIPQCRYTYNDHTEDQEESCQVSTMWQETSGIACFSTFMEMNTYILV